MSRRDRQLQLCRWLIGLNLCFIWGNSLLPAEISQAFSDWVKALVQMVSGGDAMTSGSGLLRKLAHFAEFTALGLLLSQYLHMLGKDWRKALLWGISAACIDETIQFFVPGRAPGLRDVGIDTCGVLAGMVLLQLGYFVKKEYQHYFGGKTL